MIPSRLYAPLALIAMSLLAGVVLHRTAPPEVVDRLPISLTLPTNLGAWRGETIRYCHAESCLETVLTPADRPVPTVCPKCGLGLHRISLAEQRILPESSTFSHQRYRRGRDTIMVNVVVTGSERSSIHRPEWCLPAQGFRITHTERTAFDGASGDNSAAVTLLDITRPDSPTSGINGTFAYWFIGNGRRVATHRQRLMYMAWDALREGRQHRWAYVSLLYAGPSRPKQQARELEQFSEALARDLIPAPEEPALPRHQ
jgi:hypothetical protein